jgi:flavin reductase (DIM6/NTAB) family NADH-FMN oxidoreductase RutF/DNA-binding GntR family transcriptional regulator
MVSPTTEPDQKLVDENLFRDAISRFASGVTIITTHSGGQDHGTTASAVSSLSMDPPMLLICLNRSSATQAAIHEAGFFAVNVLGDEQTALAVQFARKGDEKFAGVDIMRQETGAPLLAQALAYFECRVVELATGGTHTVFLAEVVSAAAREGTPLTYFRGKFGRFENALQELTYAKLRELILARDLPLDRALDVDELAALLDAERPQIYYALTKLSADGLVVHESAEGYFIKPLTVENAHQALDARCAVELAVVDLVVASASDADLARLRRAAERAGRSASGDAPDLQIFLRSAREFHELLVALSGNAYLVDFHGRIGVHGIWFRALAGTDWGPTVDSARFLDVADALALRDAGRAKARIGQVAAHLKGMASTAIEAAGGVL